MTNGRQFYRAPASIVIGCDPGPEHSAFAVVSNFTDPERPDAGLCVPRVNFLAYVDNDRLRKVGFDADGIWDLMSQCSDRSEAAWRLAPPDRSMVAFVFERCAVQAGGANALVFETCMAAGAIRVLADKAAGIVRAFSPSDWRYVVTGKGGADDSMVRSFLVDFIPESDTMVRKFSLAAKRFHGLRKPVTSHLRDSLGSALAAGLVQVVKGSDLGQFPGFPDVRCG